MESFELGIVGAKNSGKTTLIEKLIPLLSDRGLRVATVKHTGHNHTFDTEGKDSFRHRAAGAVMTMAVSSGEVAIFTTPDESYLEKARQLIANQCDLCLVEGDKGSNRPRLLLTRNLADLKYPIVGNIIASYGESEYSPEIRHFDLNSVPELAALIVAHYGNACKGNSNG